MEEVPPSETAPAPDDAARRRFLSRVTACAGACLGAAVAVPPALMVMTPLFRSADSAGTPSVGPTLAHDGSPMPPITARFPLGGFTVGAPPTRAVLRGESSDSWLRYAAAPLGAALVSRVSDARFRVFSATCPHLGCAVNTRAEGATPGFFCPCHGSAFAGDGSRIAAKEDGSANPSPRDLDPLPWAVAGDSLWIGWRRFVVGRADRVEVG